MLTYIASILPHVAAAEEEEVGMCGRAATAAEETSSSGVDDGRGNQWSRERRGLREFCDEKQKNLLVIGLKTRTAADCFGIQTEAVLA
jgi:hypothetical protein